MLPRRLIATWSCLSLYACVAPPPVDAPHAARELDEIVSAAKAGGKASGIEQRAYVKASNASAGDSFGYGIAISGDGSTLAVGAYDEDSGAIGIGGDQADNAAETAGAVYLFKRQGESWIQEAYIKASNAGMIDAFGYSVSLSEDGSVLAVGAPLEGSAATGTDGDQADDSTSYAGAVYLFKRHAQAWSQVAYVKATNTGPGDLFGYSVSLSGNGKLLAVSAPGEDSAATGAGGDQADDSADGAGAVYLIAQHGGAWAHAAYLKASNTGAGDFFGDRVALAAGGDMLAVSAPNEAGGAPGVDGDQADDSTYGAGAVYLFKRHGGGWSQDAYVKASNPGAGDAFGASIALSGNGKTLAVGAKHESSAATGIDGDETSDAAPAAGAVYLFERHAHRWSQDAYVKASNTGAGDAFGTSVALSENGKLLAVGASQEASAAVGMGGDQASDEAPAAGAVYLFGRHGQAWEQQAYAKASNTGAGDAFGAQLAMSSKGTLLAVSATGEASGATGVGANQTDESAGGAGAVYVLKRN